VGQAEYFARRGDDLPAEVLDAVLEISCPLLGE
jgi:hypothetical protein